MDTRLSFKEAVKKYDGLSSSKLRTIIDKGVIRAEKVRGVWRINGHDLKNFMDGKNVNAKTKHKHEELKRQKTEEELIKLRLQNDKTIQAIKDSENQKFLKHLNRIFSNFGNWPIDLEFTPRQLELWNRKMEDVAIQMEVLEDEYKGRPDAVEIT